MANHKIYYHDADYARQHGEFAAYRESNRLNRECVQAIDEGINRRPEANYLPPELANTLVSEYGAERVNLVLANTVQQKDWDGRFSHDNKEWADTFPRLENGGDYVCNAHSVFVDGLIGSVRKLTSELEKSKPSPEKVGNYTVTRSIQFDNDRGFAYGENPGAPSPFATWQFTNENGKHDHYWGHYHSNQEDVQKDYENRVNEYMADNPRLSVVVNPLAATEMSAEQNYNQIDGQINNIATPRADLTDGQTLEEIKELAPEMLPSEEKPELRQSPPPKGRKFEDVNILDALGAVVAKNTIGFQTDFYADIEHIEAAAQSQHLEDKNILWLSRRNGTECFTENNVYIADTHEHHAWTYYDASKESLVALAIQITGMVNGEVMGNLYELNHSDHVQDVKRHARTPETAVLTFNDGEQKEFPFQQWKEDFISIRQQHGAVTAQRFEVGDAKALQAHLKEQRDIRTHFPARSLGVFLKKLPQQERPSVVDKLDAAKKAVKPPAADKKPPAKSGPEL